MPKQKTLYGPAVSPRSCFTSQFVQDQGPSPPCLLPLSPSAIPRSRTSPAVHEGWPRVLGALDVLPDQISEGHNGSCGLWDPVVGPCCVVQVGHVPFCPETLLPGGMLVIGVQPTGTGSCMHPAALRAPGDLGTPGSAARNTQRHVCCTAWWLLLPCPSPQPPAVVRWHMEVARRRPAFDCWGMCP